MAPCYLELLISLFYWKPPCPVSVPQKDAYPNCLITIKRNWISLCNLAMFRRLTVTR